MPENKPPEIWAPAASLDVLVLMVDQWCVDCKFRQGSVGCGLVADVLEGRRPRSFTVEPDGLPICNKRIAGSPQ